MSPPVFIILGLCVFFGVVASVLMIVTLSADSWESVVFLPTEIRKIRGFVANESHFYVDEGFHEVTLLVDPSNKENKTSKVHYLRDGYGGIWRFCDRISGKGVVICSSR